MHKRIQIIVNPIAGAGAAGPLVRRLARRLTERQHAVSVFSTRGAGDARRLAASLSADQFDAILVAGGDGTISETIDGLVTTDRPTAHGGHPPLAILPVGTENLLGKLIKARPNIAQAEATLLAGHAQTFDVPHLGRPADRGDRWDCGAGPRAGLEHFLMIAGAGFDAEIVHRLARRRTGNISYADYAAPILQTIWQYDWPALHVEADGELVCQEPALAFVGNIPRYALGLPICHHARPDDGLLDLVVFKCASHFELAMHSLRTLLRLHLRHRRVIHRQVRSAVIRAERPVALQVDGDDCGQLPAEFTMPGHEIRLLLPP